MNAAQVNPPHSREACAFDLHSNVGVMGQEIEGLFQFLLEGVRRLRPILSPPSAGLRDLPSGSAENYDREP